MIRYSVLTLGAVIGLVYSINYTIDNHSLAGAYALGVLTTLIVGALFWSMQLVSAWFHSTWEQRRFQDNVKENYTNMLAIQRAQNEQTRGALLFADNARKHHAPQEEGGYLVFDETVFNDLEN